MVLVIQGRHRYLDNGCLDYTRLAIMVFSKTKGLWPGSPSEPPSNDASVYPELEKCLNKKDTEIHKEIYIRMYTCTRIYLYIQRFRPESRFSVPFRNLVTDAFHPPPSTPLIRVIDVINFQRGIFMRARHVILREGCSFALVKLQPRPAKKDEETGVMHRHAKPYGK